jgi:hypothetical protein
LPAAWAPVDPVLTGDLTREPPCGEIEEPEISGAEVISRALPGGSTPLPGYWDGLATHVRASAMIPPSLSAIPP